MALVKKLAQRKYPSFCIILLNTVVILGNLHVRMNWLLIRTPLVVSLTLVY